MMTPKPERKACLRGEVLDRDALPSLLPAWQDLCARNIEDNVYYSPRYAQALLASTEQDTDVLFAVVWDDLRLIALLPVTRSKFSVPLLSHSGEGWHGKYIFNGMPLLDQRQSADAAAVLLDVLASISQGEWIVRRINSQGEACKAMLAALERMKVPWHFANGFQRAALEAGGTFEQHMRRHVSAKRRSDIARNWRRLQQLGSVAHEGYRFGEGLERAVSAFLEIEASGWKGKRGTALACREETRQFALAAFTGNEANSICRADILTLNGTPIAVSLVAVAGRTGFAVKCCYDETYRKCSAGLLLEIEVIRSFFSEQWADRVDSATAGPHLVDSIWSKRIEVADLMFSLARHYPNLRLMALRTSNQTRSVIRSGVKQWLAQSRNFRKRAPSFEDARSRAVMAIKSGWLNLSRSNPRPPRIWRKRFG